VTGVFSPNPLGKIPSNTLWYTCAKRGLRGDMFVNNGINCKYIYKRTGRDWDPDAEFHSRQQKWLTRHADSSEFKVCTYIQSQSRSIRLFPATEGYDSRIEEYLACYDDLRDFSSTYDDPRTVTITTHMGSLYVTCALLKDAVRADLEVKVCLPWKTFWVRVHGHVTAYIGTFEVGTTIFSRDDYEEPDIPFTDDQDGFGTEFRLPLDRSILAVPIGSRLRVKGEVTLIVSMGGSNIYRSLYPSRKSLLRDFLGRRRRVRNPNRCVLNSFKCMDMNLLLQYFRFCYPLTS
jgi:hypothetical protein